MRANALIELARCLADEFPAFNFSTQRTCNGRSLVAEPRPGTRTALHVIITSDLEELRRALAADEKREVR